MARTDGGHANRGIPLGPRALSFLRLTAFEGGGSFKARNNADRERGAACVNAGMLVRDRRDDELFHITTEGAAYLNRLARVE